MTESVLWLWWCVVLGLAVNLGVQLLLSPGDPLVLLRRALVDAAPDRGGGRAVARWPFAGGPRPPRPSLTSLTVAGTSEMLTLLRMASLRHAWARQHHAELGALISLVDQLVTATAALEASGPPAPGEDTRARLERVAIECARTARALASTPVSAPDRPGSVECLPWRAPRPARPRGDGVGAHEIALAMPRRAGQDSRPPAPASTRAPTLLVPDAFSNPEYVQFAIRGGLACLICRAHCRIRLSRHLHLSDHLLRRRPCPPWAPARRRGSFGSAARPWAASWGSRLDVRPARMWRPWVDSGGSSPPARRWRPG